LIPQNTFYDADELQIDISAPGEFPSKTYYFDIERDRIRGYTDGQIAMKQAIYKILMTERYDWVIYSWNYGVELRDLFGKPRSYCVSEIKRRVTEALTQDDRINSVDDFSFDLSTPETVKTKFTAQTIFGSVDAEIKVPI
jgi:hypothetical protein